MDIQRIITIAQIVISVLLMLAVLFQARGTGLSGTFGGEGNVFSVRRGAEKFLFAFTIIMAVVFVGLAVTQLFLSK